MDPEILRRLNESAGLLSSDPPGQGLPVIPSGGTPGAPMDGDILSRLNEPQDAQADLPEADDLSFWDRVKRNVTMGVMPMVHGAALDATDRLAFPMDHGDAVDFFDRPEVDITPEDYQAGKGKLTGDIAQQIGKVYEENSFKGQGYWDQALQGVSSLVGFIGVGAVSTLLTGPTGGIATMATVESAAERGMVMAELINNYGMSPEDAAKRSEWVFWANLPLNYITDKAWAKLLPKGVTDKVKLLGWGDKAKLIAKGWSKQVPAETGQEVLQEVISTLTTEERMPSLKEVGHLAAVVAPVSMLPGGVHGAFQSTVKPETAPVPLEGRQQWEGEAAPEGFDLPVGDQQGGPDLSMAAPGDQDLLNEIQGEMEGETPLKAVTPEGEADQAAAAFAEELGLKPVFVEAEEQLPWSGAYVTRPEGQPNVILINQGAETPAMAVAFHEAAHEMAEEHPDLFDQLVEDLQDEVKESGEYKGWLEGLGEDTDYPDLREEFVAGVLEDVAAQESFWSNLAKRSPGSFQALAQTVSKIISKAKAALGQNAPAVLEGMTKIEDAIASATAEMATRAKLTGKGKATGEDFEAKVRYSMAKNNPETHTPSEGVGSDVAKMGEDPVDTPAMLEVMERNRQAEARLKDAEPGRGWSVFKPKSWGYGWAQGYKEMVDITHFLHRTPKQAAEKAGLDPTLKPTADPHMIMQVAARSASARAQSFIENGVPDYHTNEVKSDGLETILLKHKLGQRLERFNHYLAAKRLDSSEGEVRDKIDEDQLAEAAEIVGGVEAAEPGWADAAAEVTEWNNAVLRYLRDSGALTEKAYDAAIAMHNSFVPLHRLAGADPRAAAPKGEKAGSFMRPFVKVETGEVFAPPLETMIKNVNYLLMLQAQNESRAASAALTENLPELGREVKPTYEIKRKRREDLLRKALGDEAYEDLVNIDLISEEGLDEFVNLAFLAKDQKDGVIAFHQDGEVKYYQLHKDMYDAYRLFSHEALPKWLEMTTKPLTGSASLLRTGAIMAPGFGGKNLIRDLGGAPILAKTNITPIDALGGLYHAARKTKVFWDYVNAGSSIGGMTDVQRDALKEQTISLAGPKGWEKLNPEHYKRWPFYTVQGAYRLTEMSEHAVRLPNYQKTLARNMKKVESGEWSLRDAQLDAARNSREASIDFQRSGRVGYQMNRFGPFLNAFIQGQDNLFRSLLKDPGKKKVWAGAFAKLTLPSVLLWALVHDKEWYKERPMWEKNFFWMIPMTADGKYRLYIPKPFELGMIFASLPERIMDQLLDDEPEAVNAWVEDVKGTLMPAIKPPLLTAVDEWRSNYSDFLGRPIVSGKLENRPSMYQRTSKTSAVAKLIGKWARHLPGRKGLGLSPIQIDHAIGTMTGGVGKLTRDSVSGVIELTAPGMRKAKPSMHWAWGILPTEAPLISTFLKYQTAGGNKNEVEFYDYLTESRTAVAAMNMLKTEDLTDAEAEDLAQAWAAKALFNKAFESVANTMTDIQGFSNSLREDTSGVIDKDDKRDALDQLDRWQSKLTKDSVEEFRTARREKADEIQQYVDQLIVEYMAVRQEYQQLRAEMINKGVQEVLELER